MSNPGEDTLLVQRVQQEQIQARQEAREKMHQNQQNQLRDFFTGQQASAYENKDTRKEEQISTEISTLMKEQAQRQENVPVEKFDRTGAAYMSIKDHTQFLRNQAQMLTRDKKWYNFFKGDSKEMTYVKQSLNYLNNLLDSTDNVILIREKISEAYRVLLTACDGYIFTHPEPKHSTGKKRLARVKQIQQMVKEEQTYFEIAINNLQARRLEVKEDATPRDVIASVREKKAVASIYSTEGNSSDVYRVILKDKDGKPYVLYLKKDEKLLNEDLDGFLNRRVEQLQRSLANKKAICEANNIKDEAGYLAKVKETEAEISRHEQTLDNEQATEEEKKAAADAITQLRSGQEELRLTAGRLDDQDYDFAVRFLNKMKDSLAVLGPEERKQKQERYLKFLGHDFDSFFQRRVDYNAMAERIGNDQEKIRKEMENYQAQVKKGGAGTEAAQEMVKALEKALTVGFKVQSEYEWIESRAEELGLNKTEDAEILQMLSELVPKQRDEHTVKDRISRLFLRSLGKEAELYGQQCERSGLADTTEALASNNTATARLAAFCNMRDVVTGSWKEMMTFQEFGKTEMTTALCTVSEVAEGEEMLSLVKQAEDIQKQKKLKKSILHYSPNAMRQLMRLQMFDTLCLQTDRHWRNFKCKVKRSKNADPPVWVIESLKSYDHDQSFGPKNLKTYFEEKTDANGMKYTNRPGFIPPILATVDKSTKLYAYLKETKMGGLNDIFFKKIKKPVAEGKLAEAMEKFAKEHDGKGFFEANNKMGIFSMVAFSNPKYFMKDFAEAARQANPEHLEQQGDQKEASLPDQAERLVVDFVRLFYRVARLSGDALPLLRKDVSQPKKDEKIVKIPCKTDIVRCVRDFIEIYPKVDLKSIEEYVDEPQSTFASYFKPFLDKDGKMIPGSFDYLIRSTLYMAKTILLSRPDVMSAFEMEEAEEAEIELREEVRKNPVPGMSEEEQLEMEKKKRGIGERTVKVPTMLHMDKEAFEGIRKVVTNWEEVRLTLLDLGWSTEKQLALKERAEEIVQQALEAEQIVKQWAKQKGYPDDDIHAKFFLDAEDYDKIEDIKDLVADPSMSYFSIEDPNFLADEDGFKDMITASEKKEIIEQTNKMRGTERQRLDKLEGEYHQMVNGKVMTVSELERLEKEAEEKQKAKKEEKTA